MKKNNKLGSTILSLIIGVIIFFVIDWVFYMNFITGDSKTITFLLGVIIFLIYGLSILMNDMDKRTIQSIDYKDNFFGRIQKGWAKFLRATSKYMIKSSLVIIVLSILI